MRQVAHNKKQRVVGEEIGGRSGHGGRTMTDQGKEKGKKEEKKSQCLTAKAEDGTGKKKKSAPPPSGKKNGHSNVQTEKHRSDRITWSRGVQGQAALWIREQLRNPEMYTALCEGQTPTLGGGKGWGKGWGNWKGGAVMATEHREGVQGWGQGVDRCHITGHGGREWAAAEQTKVTKSRGLSVKPVQKPKGTTGNKGRGQDSNPHPG